MLKNYLDLSIIEWYGMNYGQNSHSVSKRLVPWQNIRKLRINSEWNMLRPFFQGIDKRKYFKQENGFRDSDTKF